MGQRRKRVIRARTTSERRTSAAVRKREPPVPLIPKNPDYYVALIAGAPADIFREVQLRLALTRRTFAKYHWDYEKSRFFARHDIPAEVDFVVVLREHIGHSGQDGVLDAVRRRNQKTPVVVTSHKWSTMASALAHRFAMTHNEAVPESAMEAVDRALRERIESRLGLTKRQRTAEAERLAKELGVAIEGPVEAAAAASPPPSPMPAAVLEPAAEAEPTAPVVVESPPVVHLPSVVAPVLVEMRDADLVLMLARAIQDRLAGAGIAGVLITGTGINVERRP